MQKDSGASTANSQSISDLDARWLAALIVLPLFIAAAVRMPLFQDGASYLVEIMISHSAVRHDRYSVFLIQSPSSVALTISELAGLNPVATLRLTSWLFNISYAALPGIVMTWSWLLVRNRDRHLILWPLLVLVLNAINFSWVSEILIAMLFACPLMLAAIQRQPSGWDWLTILLLVPFIFLLHALVPLLFLGLAAGVAVRAAEEPASRRRSVSIAVCFLAAGAARLALNALHLTGYEREMLSSSNISEYFQFSLSGGLLIAVIMLISLTVAISRLRSSRYLSLFFAFLAAGGIFTTILNLAAGALGGVIPLSTWIAFSAIFAAGLSLSVWLSHKTKTLMWVQTGVLALWCTTAAATSAMLLIRVFPLKSGTTVAMAALVLVLIGKDSLNARTSERSTVSRPLAINLTTAFAVALLLKASIWTVANDRLNQARMRSESGCMERSNPAFAWLELPPYTIINNWSLPSLTITNPQDNEGTRLVLEQGDCSVLSRNAIVTIDPWSRVPLAELPFVRLPPDIPDGR